MNIKIWTKDLQKYFEKGEMVRIMSGVHAGGSGTITAILDKHAIIAMEGTRHELKILISNLKIKRDEMDHCVKTDGLVKKTVSIKVSYSAGDLILFDNYKSVGLVLEVLPNHLRVLNTRNEIQNVKLQEISSKHFPR
jgi:ribosomal protein L24